jgi:hypothetical protein
MTPEATEQLIGSLDGIGAGDHDMPFRFGMRPRVEAPFPFSTRQFARLLVLRARIGDRGAAALQDAGANS